MNSFGKVCFGILLSFSLNAAELTGGLSNPDKIFLEESSEKMIVANVNGVTGHRDSQASLVKVALEKGSFKADWLAKKDGRLNSPRGMAFIDRYLVVADIDRICFFKFNSQQMSASYLSSIKVPGTRNISDIKVVGRDILIADEESGGILRLSHYSDPRRRKYKALVRNVPGIVDMHIDGTTLYFLSSKSNFVFQLDLESGKGKRHPLLVKNNLPGFSGLTRGKEGEFYLTHAELGAVYLFKPENKSRSLLFKSGLVQPRDVVYLSDLNMLAVLEGKEGRLSLLKPVKSRPAVK